MKAIPILKVSLIASLFLGQGLLCADTFFADELARDGLLEEARLELRRRCGAVALPGPSTHMTPDPTVDSLHSAPAWQRWPSELIVGLYRRQIAPAIGERCALHPSCSAYFIAACRERGLLGFALLADRLFREPQASTEDNVITLPDGRRRVSDPLSTHTKWLKP